MPYKQRFIYLDFNRMTFTPLFVYYGTDQKKRYQILTADSTCIYMKELLIDWNFHIKNEHKSLKGWNRKFQFSRRTKLNLINPSLSLAVKSPQAAQTLWEFVGP